MLQAVRLNASTYPVESAERQQLSEAGAELIEVEAKEPEEILLAARHCHALLVVSSRVPGHIVEQLENCRIIARLGAGTDNIDVAMATQCGIVVSNVPDFCTNEQAEHTMALLLTWARRLPFMFDAMHKGDWSARHHTHVHRLAGQTLGLIGFGTSARAVAERALAFGMRVITTVRQPANYHDLADRMHVDIVDIDQLLREADFVSLHVPLTAETRHFFDADKLRRMKPAAVLINTSRGALIDESALIDALQRQHIAGAALDVFEGIDVFGSPGAAPKHPLLELNNVLLTPHCAGSSVESSRDSKTRGSLNAALVLRGQWPPYVLNPEVQPREQLHRAKQS
jgi:D-3-phosphoglycerate dehydrogenase